MKMFKNITKSYKNSYFIRFHLKSEFSECILCEDARDMNNKKERIVVLQMLICEDMQVIAEIMKKIDYEELAG